MTYFVAFSGKKQAGKDTAARYLRDSLRQRQRDIDVEITHFAEPLKKMCHIVFGIPMDLIYGTDADKETFTDVLWDNLLLGIRIRYSIEQREPVSGLPVLQAKPRSGPMTVREVLQIMGTDIFRDQVEDTVWANAPFRRQWDADVVLLPDCRFANEADATLRHGGRVIRMLRDTGLVDHHASETALDDYDFASAGALVVGTNDTSIPLPELREIMDREAIRILEKIR